MFCTTGNLRQFAMEPWVVEDPLGIPKLEEGVLFVLIYDESGLGDDT